MSDHIDPPRYVSPPTVTVMEDEFGYFLEMQLGNVVLRIPDIDVMPFVFQMTDGAERLVERKIKKIAKAQCKLIFESEQVREQEEQTLSN